MSSIKKRDIIDLKISDWEASSTLTSNKQLLVSVLKEMNRKIKYLEKELDKKAKKIPVIGPSPGVIDN